MQQEVCKMNVFCHSFAIVVFSMLVMFPFFVKNIKNSCFAGIVFSFTAVSSVTSTGNGGGGGDDDR